jgi:hypothetical protein
VVPELVDSLVELSTSQLVLQLTGMVVPSTSLPEMVLIPPMLVRVEMLFSIQATRMVRVL